MATQVTSDQPDQNASAPMTEAASALRSLDQQYDHNNENGHGLLGYGSFSTVLLGCKRSSGRLVALKIFDRSDSNAEASFARQVDALLHLDTTSDGTSSSSQQQRGAASILYMRDWLESGGVNTVGCIVSQYAPGGTLQEELRNRGQHPDFPFYAERRIRWYARQIVDAVGFMHSRNVMHGNISSSRVLIDREDGKLILSGFGSAIVLPSHDATFPNDCPSPSFYDRYGAPEVCDAIEQKIPWSSLQPWKVDAFAVGCVLFEVVCCTPLSEFGGDETLGQFLRRVAAASSATDDGATAILQLAQVKLPWLPPGEISSNTVNTMGYTHNLACLLLCLLGPDPTSRINPEELSTNTILQQCPDVLTAAEDPQPGAPLTVDNIQLGMFVQRGRDWDGNDDDGGPGSIGYVCRRWCCSSVRTCSLFFHFLNCFVLLCKVSL